MGKYNIVIIYEEETSEADIEYTSTLTFVNDKQEETLQKVKDTYINNGYVIKSISIEKERQNGIHTKE